MSAGKKFRQALADNKPLQILGTINAYTAMMAKSIGHKAIYLSGGGVANASYGLPDLGMTSLNDVIVDVQRITSACDLPLLVDIDTGWGGAFNIAKTIRDMEKAGAAAVHMEDQQLPKRCGHLSGKHIVSTNEFVQKIKAVKDTASNDFYLIARTDAIAVEGFDKAIERGHKYMEAGADMLFIEAPTTVEQIERIGKELPYPKLLNMFYSGKTPIVPLEKLKSWGYNLVIDPSDLQRASIYAMQETLKEVKRCGHSEGIKDRLVSFKEREHIIGTEKYMDVSEKYKDK